MSTDSAKSARSHASRRHTRLNTKLDANLIAYAAAAGAAGVSMLARAQPAEARIVYTATHQRITGHTLLDLNNDGTNDFEFTNHISTRIGIHETFTVNSYGNLQVYGLNPSNQVWGQGTVASRLAPGISVGSTGQFPGGKEMGGFVGTDGQPHTTSRLGRRESLISDIESPFPFLTMAYRKTCLRFSVLLPGYNNGSATSLQCSTLEVNDSVQSFGHHHFRELVRQTTSIR